MKLFLVSLTWLFLSIEIGPIWLKEVFTVLFFSLGYSLHRESILDQQINKYWNSFCVLFHFGHCGGYSARRSGASLEELIVRLGEMM